MKWVVKLTSFNTFCWPIYVNTSLSRWQDFNKMKKIKSYWEKFYKCLSKNFSAKFFLQQNHRRGLGWRSETWLFLIYINFQKIFFPIFTVFWGDLADSGTLCLPPVLKLHYNARPLIFILQNNFEFVLTKELMERRIIE